MNAQTLERLLIDDSLAALNEDVAALLAAYLANDTTAAKAAAEFERTADGALRVFAADDDRAAGRAAAALPAFPSQRIAAAARSAALWRWTRRASALAASLALGVGLGAAWFASAPPATHTAPGAGGPGEGGAAGRGPTIVHRGMHPDRHADGRGEIWSVRHMVERAARGESGGPERFIWNSPIRKPRIGAAT